MKTNMAAVILAILLAAAPAMAGWKVQENGVDGKTLVYIKKGMLRLDDGIYPIIFNTNNKTVTFLNSAQGKYWSGNVGEFARSFKSQMDAQLEAELAKMPPEQRKAIRQMMDGGNKKAEKQFKVEVKQKGAGPVITGRATRIYEVWVDGKLRRKVWLAKVKGMEQDMDWAKAAKMAANMGMDQANAWEAAPQVLELAVKGYPMKTQEIEEDGGVSESIVTNIRQKELDASLFALPKQYQAAPLSVVLQ